MRRPLRHQFRRTTLYLAACLAFLVGIGLANTGFHFSVFYIWWSLLALVMMFRKRTVWAALFVVLFGLSLGWWRGSLYMQKLADYEPLYYQKITITAEATEDAVYGKNKQLTFTAKKIRLDDGQSLVGRVVLSGFGLNAIYQGDEVEVTGTLRPTLGASQGRMSYGTVELVEHHDSLVGQLRRKFAAGMLSALPEPLASFAMGLLIGQRATLPDEVKQDLLMVGLTHIIAVSGYNLTIILRASKNVLGKRSKRLSTLLSLGLIAIFLLLAGNSASIVRAAIVSMLSIAAGYYGRQVRPLLLLALAASITAFANPLYVWSDTSWYLSFLAFYGVMVISPLIAVRLPKRWQDSLIAMVALESISAETMTLPFVLHTFGQMSFIGLVANVLVVTLVPLAMLLGVIAGLAGMLIAPLAGWLAWPARLLLAYMLDIAHLLSRLPHIFVENLDLNLAEMLGLYGLIILFTIALWFKTKTKNAKITDRNQVLQEGV